RRCSARRARLRRRPSRRILPAHRARSARATPIAPPRTGPRPSRLTAPLLLSLLAEPLAFLGRHLSPALAEPLAFLGRHLPPALLIAEHALTLLGRHRLPLSEPLQDAVSALGRQPLEALVRFLQLVPPLLGSLVPALKVFEDLRPLLGRELAEALVALARRL